MNLLKLKKCKGLVSDDDHRHTVQAVNQIMNKGLDMINPEGQQTAMDKKQLH